MLQDREGRRSQTILKRVVVCIVVCIFVLVGFYLSLIGTAKSLSYDEKKTVSAAIALLCQRGFANEAFLLDNLTVYRSNDNWLNASVDKENAFAATNFPFEIMTLYPDFFADPMDDTERAAILLHEAQHLKGKNEHDAYAFVWKNRQKLGWTEDIYRHSTVWRNVRKQTKDNAPELFVCGGNEYGDCTQ